MEEKPSNKRSLEKEADEESPQPKREKTVTYSQADAAPERPEDSSSSADGGEEEPTPRSPSYASDGEESANEVPVIEESAKVDAQEAAEADATKPPLIIMVVDDSAAVRKITKAKLEGAGYIVELASNGEEALAKYTSESPSYYHVILLDIYMPVLDGVRLANIIREREAAEAKGNHQLIIGLSAETRDITSDTMDSCLLKPFNLDSFERCVGLFHVR